MTLHEHGKQIIRPTHGGEAENATLDYSVNLHVAAETIPDSLWLKWKHQVQKYPPPTSTAIEQALGDCLKTCPEMLLCTNGGTEALSLSLSLAKPRHLHLPTPCFSEYKHLCEQQQIPYTTHTIPPEQWFHSEPWLRYHANSAHVLANPNNPTGHTLSATQLSEAIKQSESLDTLWIVDEAFIEFTSKQRVNSLIPRLKEHPNLIVCGSLTKAWNIPGLRLGYLATSNQELLESLRQRQLTWAHNGLVHNWTQHYLNTEYYNKNLESLKCYTPWRTSFTQELQQTTQLTPLNSDCNYLLCRVEENSPIALNTSLLKHGIATRLCHSIPGMETLPYLRIAVRSPDDNARFIQTLNALPSKS